MTKRVYVAAPWVDRGNAQDVAATLEANGYDVTMDWWNYELGEAEAEDKAAFRRMCAFKDFRGVRTADAVLLINSSKSEGKAVEQGIAIALGIPIVTIGELGAFSSNVFHYLPQYHWVKDLYEALDKLKEVLGG